MHSSSGDAARARGTYKPQQCRYEDASCALVANPQPPLPPCAGRPASYQRSSTGHTLRRRMNANTHALFLTEHPYTRRRFPLAPFARPGARHMNHLLQALQCGSHSLKLRAHGCAGCSPAGDTDAHRALTRLTFAGNCFRRPKRRRHAWPLPPFLQALLRGQRTDAPCAHTPLRPPPLALGALGGADPRGLDHLLQALLGSGLLAGPPVEQLTVERPVRIRLHAAVALDIAARAALPGLEPVRAGQLLAQLHG